MTRKPVIFISSFICVLAIVAYCYAWHYTADLIRIQLHNLYDDAARVGMTVEGDFPTVTGFPGPHRVHFSGKLVQGARALSIPDLTIKGLFLPGHRVTVSAPQGLSLTGVDNPALWSLSRLDLKATIPVIIPATTTAEDIQVWQQAGGQIVINSFSLEKNSLMLSGTGTIMLDTDLQPAGSATVKMTGYMDFIDWLKTQHVIKGKEASLARIVLTGLSRTDQKTNEQYLETVLTIKNRELYVGPLALATLPPVGWVSRNPPAPPR